MVTGKKIRQKRKTKNEVVQPVTSEVDSIESSTIIKKSRKKRAKVVKDNIDIIENTINSVQDTVNQDNDEIINVSKEELLVTIIPNKSDTNTVVNSSFNQELEYALNHSEILCIPDSFESNINQDSDIEYNISEDLGNIFDTNFDNVSDNDDVIIISDSNMIINDIKTKDIKAVELITNTVNNQNDVENISAFIKQHSQNSRNNDQVTLCTDEYNYSDNSTLNSSDIILNNQDSVNIVNNNDSTIASLSVSAEAGNKIVEKRKAKAIKTLKIRKRDGRIVDFDTSKIFNALKHAFQNVINDNELDDDIDDEMLSSLVSKIIGSIKKQAKILEDNILPVETIQDIIEDTLLKVKQFEVAKTFIRYRANRTQMREANNDLISLYKKIHNASSEELEIKRDNANVNGNASMGVMLKLGTESNKYFLLEHVMKKEYAQAHKEGYIHIHDLDMSNVTLNCAQINLQKLFKSGFSTGHGYLRSPNSIRSYASLACIAIQSNQNEMFGGQSINLFDFYMSDGVRKSFKKAFKHNILIAAKTILKGSNLFDAYVEIVEDRLLPKYLDQNSLEIAIQDFLNNNDEDTYSDQIIVRCFKFAFDQACKDVEEETHQAMEALVHNFNTLASRAGSQVPFSSINFGCDISHEGRLVTKEVLNAVYAGLGRGETSIFPICVFQIKAGINYNPGDPNYDLFQQSIKCSAKRLFPTYMSEDATYNAQYYDPKNIQTLCATMGCRTRVMGNVNGPQESGSRGNFAFTTINLPMIAIEAEQNIGKFFEIFDKYIQLAHDYLLERFNLICQKHIYNFPFLLGQKVYMGSELLRKDDTLFEALKHSSISIGFVGLAECLTSLIGQHHGESPAAQQLGLMIINHLRAMTDQYTVKDHLNWTTFATPAESCAGRLCLLTRKKYGIISGVTDKEYFTNSMHIPVSFKISVADKIKLEAPYHELCNAGVIFYAEFDGDATKNLSAFETVIRACHDANMNYFAINTKSADYCPACGNASFINDKCPICGYQEHVDNQHYTVDLLSSK